MFTKSSTTTQNINNLETATMDNFSAFGAADKAQKFTNYHEAGLVLDQGLGVRIMLDIDYQEVLEKASKIFWSILVDFEGGFLAGTIDEIVSRHEDAWKSAYNSALRMHLLKTCSPNVVGSFLSKYKPAQDMGDLLPLRPHWEM